MTADTENPDYIEVSHIPGYPQATHWDVRLLKWDKIADSYLVKDQEGPMSFAAAAMRARQWAQQLGIESKV